MPSADSDGVSIHYELAGTGNSLVLIGGLGVHTGEYRPLIDALAQHHRVLAADNRGAGLSDKPDVPYSYAMMAADTLVAMDDAHVDVADIVGFSMGARIALELCLANPERVRTLTLIAGRPAGRSRRRVRLLTRFAAASERDAGHGIRRQLDAGSSLYVRGRLMDIQVPALVLHGRHDRIAPIAGGRELARLVPGAEFDAMPGSHVAVLRAQAVAYAQRIDAFTSRADRLSDNAREPWATGARAVSRTARGHRTQKAQSVAHKQPGQTCFRYPTRLSKSVPSVALSAACGEGRHPDASSRSVSRRP